MFTLWMEIKRLWVTCCFQRWVLCPVEWEGRGLGQCPLPSEGSPAYQGCPLDFILGAAAPVVHTDGEQRLGSLGTEMSKGLSLTLELTFFWLNHSFWVALRGMPHPRLLGGFSCSGQASRSWARDPLATRPKQEHLASSCSRRPQCS